MVVNIYYISINQPEKALLFKNGWWIGWIIMLILIVPNDNNGWWWLVDDFHDGWLWWC